MKLLYIADGRSPTALNWMSYFIGSPHDVHLVSTFPCQPIPGLASFDVIPVALSGVYGRADGLVGAQKSLLKKLIPVRLRTRIRQLTAPLSFPQAINALQRVIDRVQPDLIHAMRIPFEGIVASLALEQSKLNIPLLVSVWGNDFTLHARASATLEKYTRQVLQRCNGLHTDCLRDMQLAYDFGFDTSKPRVVLPGGGGIKLDLFYPPADETKRHTPATVINPRGFRAYIRNDTFFQAIPLVLNTFPDVRFVCTGMAGESQAQKWVKELGIESHVDLLTNQTPMEMAALFRRSLLSLSISTHDGTPNTLLEAIACGCFPIAGDIDSLREWIKPGVNGLLVDPANPQALADAILTALSIPVLQERAMVYNLDLIRERAEYTKTMQAALNFYSLLVSSK